MCRQCYDEGIVYPAVWPWTPCGKPVIGDPRSEYDDRLLEVLQGLKEVIKDLSTARSDRPQTQRSERPTGGIDVEIR